MILTITGHRPVHLPCQYNEDHEWAVKIKSKIKQHIMDSFESNQIHFHVTGVITGMALGMDTWAAEVALAMKIPVFAYVPFKGQGDNWPLKARDRYERILLRAEKVFYTSDKYSKNAFFIRDEKMVDDGDRVLALWNPAIQSGGTYHTIQYAIKKEKSVNNLWE